MDQSGGGREESSYGTNILVKGVKKAQRSAGSVTSDKWGSTDQLDYGS